MFIVYFTQSEECLYSLQCCVLDEPFRALDQALHNRRLKFKTKGATLQYNRRKLSGTVKSQKLGTYTRYSIAACYSAFIRYLPQNIFCMKEKTVDLR
jgi:hypothetical protein